MSCAIELLKDNGIKVTPQRVAITETIQESGHIDIDGIYRSIIEQFPSLSLATIYKNINSMVERQFIQEVSIPSGKPKFEIVKESHGHLICPTCGSVTDIEVDETVLGGAVKEDFDRFSLSIYRECCYNSH
jgi:Fur family peroxide stress response transcriptional regulator